MKESIKNRYTWLKRNIYIQDPFCLVFVLELKGNSLKKGSQDWSWTNRKRWIPLPDWIPNSIQMLIQRGCQFNSRTRCKHQHQYLWVNLSVNLHWLLLQHYFIRSCWRYSHTKCLGEKPQSHVEILTCPFSHADYHSHVKSSLSTWPPT